MSTPQDKVAEIDVRLSRIDGIVDQMSQRLSSVEQEQRDVLSWIRWLVGIQITTLVTLGALILLRIG